MKTYKITYMCEGFKHTCIIDSMYRAEEIIHGIYKQLTEENYVRIANRIYLSENITMVELKELLEK